MPAYLRPDHDWRERTPAALSFAMTLALTIAVVQRIDFHPPAPPPEPERDISVTLEATAPEAPPAASPPPSENPPPETPPAETPPPPEPPPPPPDAPPPMEPPPPPPPPKTIWPKPVVKTPPRPVQAMQAPASPAPPVAAPVQATAKPAPAAPPPSAGIEATFIGQLRAYIKTITHYPNSKEARLLRPQGNVEVQFTLSRAGAVSDVGLLRPSGSQVLDQQALSIVRSGAYPPFPPTAWNGEPVHRFTVTVEFQP